MGYKLQDYYLPSPNSTTGGKPVGQSFTASSSYILYKILVRIIVTLAEPDDDYQLPFYIEAVGGDGYPTEIPLGTGYLRVGDLGLIVEKNHIVTISPAVALVSGTSYYIVMDGDGVNTPNTDWRGRSTTGAYAGGKAVSKSGGVWSDGAPSPADMYFATYSIVASECIGSKLVTSKMI